MPRSSKEKTLGAALRLIARLQEVELTQTQCAELLGVSIRQAQRTLDVIGDESLRLGLVREQRGREAYYRIPVP